MASAIESEVNVLEKETIKLGSHAIRLRALIFTAKKIVEQRERMVHHIENEIVAKLTEAFKRRDHTMIIYSINMVKELLVRMQNGIEIFPAIEKHLIEREIKEWDTFLKFLVEVKTTHVVNASKGERENFQDLHKVLNEMTSHFEPISERTSSYLTTAISAWEGTAALIETEVKRVRKGIAKMEGQVRRPAA